MKSSEKYNPLIPEELVFWKHILSISGAEHQKNYSNQITSTCWALIFKTTNYVYFSTFAQSLGLLWPHHRFKPWGPSPAWEASLLLLHQVLSGEQEVPPPLGACPRTNQKGSLPGGRGATTQPWRLSNWLCYVPLLTNGTLGQNL